VACAVPRLPAGGGGHAWRPASEALAVFGMKPASSTPAEFKRLLRCDYERWGSVVKATGSKFRVNTGPMIL
jgi:hypothetical protein